MYSKEDSTRSGTAGSCRARLVGTKGRAFRGLGRGALAGCGCVWLIGRCSPHRPTRLRHLPGRPHRDFLEEQHRDRGHECPADADPHHRRERQREGLVDARNDLSDEWLDELLELGRRAVQDSLPKVTDGGQVEASLVLLEPADDLLEALPVRRAAAGFPRSTGWQIPCWQWSGPTVPPIC